jgi:hypothetical protein
MEEHFFHIHPDNLDHNQFTLSEEESQHFLKSLREKKGIAYGSWMD